MLPLVTSVLQVLSVYTFKIWLPLSLLLNVAIVVPGTTLDIILFVLSIVYNVLVISSVALTLTVVTKIVNTVKN